MIRDLFKLKPMNIAAWATAGAAMYAWTQYDNQKQNSASFSSEEMQSWNDNVKSRNPKGKSSSSEATPSEQTEASS
eukprot:CAMPEP_0171500258 /NCGR_PEP_ID=MMETSP0958-20121227/8888_1 /TAXON_ID=87120 /ORGANISM="Aurantiochytrium limacinum, Strain ATCCMYA-1381" /LENGTH=75 /DNA_ID=CAMNT_0012034913 /DNA_START=101 /DNA_END=328 /DNA_ORIENTATION=-